MFIQFNQALYKNLRSAKFEDTVEPGYNEQTASSFLDIVFENFPRYGNGRHSSVLL